MSKHILILPGDGIGPEVTTEVVRLIDWMNAERGAELSYSQGLIGGAGYDAEGTPLPAKTIADAKAADAVLLGAVGGPQYDVLPFDVRPERGLLGIRKELGLYANLRPAICFDALADASSLKREIVAGLDILIVRELTGDLYFGEPRGVQVLNDGTKRGYNTMVYTTPEIERIGRTAFELARKRGRRVCSVDKANVLECTGLWREVVQELRDKEYGDIELSHMYVDNAAMQLVRTPKQFDVMVTGNMFGDILSDAAAMLTGSLGMLPSASLGTTSADGRTPGLYEPVHGSAPDIAGKGVANPLATILSFAMMLRYSLDMAVEADMVEAAVQLVLADGIRTADIMADGSRKVGTAEMGQAVLSKLTTAARADAA